MTKTIAISLMAVLLIGMFATNLILADTNTSADDEQSLNLDEDVSEGQITWKQMGLWFTFDQERKAEKGLELARLRLIQAKVAAKNNNSDAMEKALEAHEKILERVKERMSKIEDGKDINESAVKLRGLDRAIQVHERRIAFLNGLLENANLTEDQRAKIELRIAKAENITARLSELNEEKKSRLQEKAILKYNLTEEESKKFVEDEDFRKEVKESSREERRNREQSGNESEDDSEEDLNETEQEDNSELDDSGNDSPSDLNDSEED